MKDNYTIDVNETIKLIKREIYNNGPVVSSFFVYDDFQDYWKNDAPYGSVYVRKSDNKDGGHAVVITGWGKQKGGQQDGIEYWEIRNSWGGTVKNSKGELKNGDNGYCKIALSTNTPSDKWCQIDIPYIDNNGFNGGVISFLPDKLELNDTSPDVIKKIDSNVKTPEPESFFDKHKYEFISGGIILIILIILIIFISIISKTNKKINVNNFNSNILY